MQRNAKECEGIMAGKNRSRRGAKDGTAGATRAGMGRAASDIYYGRLRSDGSWQHRQAGRDAGDGPKSGAGRGFLPGAFRSPTRTRAARKRCTASSRPLPNLACPPSHPILISTSAAPISRRLPRSACVLCAPLDPEHLGILGSWDLHHSSSFLTFCSCICSFCCSFSFLSRSISSFLWRRLGVVCTCSAILGGVVYVHHLVAVVTSLVSICVGGGGRRCKMASRMGEMFYGEPVYRTSYHQQSNRGPFSRSQSVYPERARGHLPVLELRVPMCCEKCQEKVKEELEELEGVQDVICDQYNQRVTVTGFVDPHRALKKVKKVKKKSEFFTEGSYIEGSSHYLTRPNHHSDVHYTGNRMVHNHNGYGLTRSNSFGRGFDRLPSFGRVTPYDHGDRYNDYDLGDRRRDFASVRRMPSFNRHRYHDAEYISADYPPYYGDSNYVSHHSHRPVYRSQVSFADIPVTNPYYIQRVESEYY